MGESAPGMRGKSAVQIPLCALLPRRFKAEALHSLEENGLDLQPRGKRTAHAARRSGRVPPARPAWAQPRVSQIRASSHTRSFAVVLNV